MSGRGYQMTGLDLDPLFLRMAQQEADRRGLQVRLEHCDMRDIPFESEFDAVINMFTAFGYLDSDEEDQKVLHAVAQALKPDGLFLMELMSRDMLMRVYQPRGWHETPDGVKVLQDRTFDLVEGRNHVRQVTIYPDGRVEEAHHVLRVYTPTELAKMLGEAGMAVEAAFGGLDQSPLTVESNRLVMLARKR